MKCLITIIDIVSLVYSRTNILQREVFFIETIDNIPQEKLTHLKAIFFCRSTDETINKIAQELQEPKFSQYNLYFSNSLYNDRIQKLAESDLHNVVNQIQEVYADFSVINEDLFNLNIPSVIGLTAPVSKWTIQDQQHFNRMIDAIYSVALATRSYPQIRFQKRSEICFKLADKLQEKLNEEQEFLQRISKNSQPTSLLILDRREDPITPLLNQWTYQAMIHEILGINNNRVDMKSRIKNLSEDMAEVVISSEDDQFFKAIMYKNFGEVAEDIHNLVQKFLKNKQSQAQFSSIEDMQRIIENFPEFKQGERNTTKHFHILEELRKVVDGRKLYDLSEIEQDLVSGNENKAGHFKQVEDQINNSEISKMEKLRLSLIFSLRYENDEKVFKLKEQLKKVGLAEQQVKIIDCIIEYAGKARRSGDLFQNKDLFSKGTKIFKSYFKEVQNVLLQHKPQLMTQLDNIFKGKLNPQEYPATQATDYRDKPTNVLVFIVGGVTFEEAKEIALTYNQQQVRVVIGGNCIHNMQSFLADISQISMIKGEMARFEIEP
eukprot:403366130